MKNFYTNLFKDDAPICDFIVTWSTYPNIVEEHHVNFSARVTLDECKRSLFNMGTHKAPKEDEYPTIFSKSVGKVC